MKRIKAILILWNLILLPVDAEGSVLDSVGVTTNSWTEVGMNRLSPVSGVVKS